MLTQVHTNPSIYKIDVPLPNSPLKVLNAYVFPEADRPLIIDTGFNRPECLTALMEGLSELSIDLTKTDLFLTHLHGDHTGLAVKLAEKGCTIYMNPTDHAIFKDMRSGAGFDYLSKVFFREGFPQAELDLQSSNNHAIIYMAESTFDAHPVMDGDILNFAGQEFKAITTPGHTPGHTCLYLPKASTLFLGDHVLFDITPNITIWPGVQDSLANYLESLKKIVEYPVLLPLPAHRNNMLDLLTRVRQLEEHHGHRLQETLTVVQTNPGLTAYEIASRMTWSMRGKKWPEFPVGQKWFAVGETIAHLEYLTHRQRIERRTIKSLVRYWFNQDPTTGRN
ncbi:MAG: MBL fold metallo-hydrolase [Christensenella sp.]|uniref:MBL fold metallo-hydrolase n=1 Tax=Christensenella sp. TaxID=1935934 RepID=UPI002B21D7EE|nr:MBL fold metallo-hydrolase [Christensenella sp.]MEA5002521.1 MBL fold metallo-hydrolase [Christensenella sp.]